MAESLFATETMTEVVKVHPRALGADVMAHVAARLRARYEDRCSTHGYFAPGSIEVLRVGAPLIEAHTLRGFVKFPVEFRARVFNPPEKAVVEAVVRVVNNFGILAVVQVDGREIMHLVVPRQIAALRSVIPEGIAVGDLVEIEIVRRKVVDGEGVLYGMGRIHKQGIALTEEVVVGAAARPALPEPVEEGEEDVLLVTDDEDMTEDVVSLLEEGTSDESSVLDDDEVEVSDEEEDGDEEEDTEDEEEDADLT